MTTSRVDIFKILNGVNKKNRNFYHSLTQDEKKTVIPVVMLKWMMSSIDERQIVFLNEIVNPFMFPLTNNKDLLMDLFCICGSGRSQKYSWLVPKKKITKTPLTIKLLQEYFGYNSKDTKDIVKLLPTETIIDYASQLGWQEDEIKKLNKELK